MNLLIKTITISTVVAAGLLMAVQSDAQITFTGSGSGGGDNFSGQVTFSLSGVNQLTVTVVNTTAVGSGVWDAGELLSGLSFNVTGSTGSGVSSGSGNISSLFTVKNGVNSYVNEGSSSIVLPTGTWQIQNFGSGGINLNVFSGGQPQDMIIGLDSHGGTSGTGVDGGTYDENGSVFEHQPVVLDSATFVLSVTNITSLSQITNVVFNFGTQEGEGTAHGTPVPVPESTTILSAALMLVPLSVQLIRKGWKRSQPKTD